MSYTVLPDGFSTIISFGLQSSVKFKEKEVQPPGFDGGGSNPTSTMRNTRYRTFAPKRLMTVTECTLKVAYDPAVLPEIIGMLQANQQLTTTHADGSSWVWYGWLESFKPDSVKEGVQPEATVVLIPSNTNGTGAETGPVYNAGTTTTSTTEVPG